MRYSFFTIIILLGTLALDAQTILQKLNNSYSTLIKDPQIKYASTSFTIINTKTGQVIFEKNKDQKLCPASTLKTLTTSTALALLGEDYTFKTDFIFKGQIENNAAIGTLYIIPSGDPTFGSTRFKNTTPEAIFSQLKDGFNKINISSFKGEIVIDETYFKDQAINDDWLLEDIGNYYGAGIYPLNWKENKFEVALSPNGNSFAIANCKGNFKPTEFIVDVKHQANASTDDVYAFLEKNGNASYAIRGVLDNTQSSQTIEVASIHPVEDFKKELITFLKKEMRFEFIKTSPSTTEKNICTMASPPLSEIVYWCNQKSLNLYAEAICKTLATKFYAAPSWIAGISVIKKAMQLKGIDSVSVALSDGSGLSPNDKITTFMLASVLSATKKEKYFPVFFKSLPVINDLHMKSGYIGGTRSYAGYTTLPDGTDCSFSFIVSNFNGSPRTVKEKMFTFLNTLK
jgi:D-alanyl-D-alanine carboxypeptidase/D-alanyl-D-alanine-endopeptidase (penicillin-binding protein 4)